jgi:RNA polymerase sigma-70 factor (ECF subfamily)
MPAPERKAVEVMQDGDLVEALRAGDERAFLELVGQLHGGLVRFALGFVRTQAAAEEVVQEGWAAVVQSIDRFEGRCTLRSWIFGIVANVARTRAVADRRSVPLSALQPDEERAVEATEFLPDTHSRWAGHWARWPDPWPDQCLLSQETLQQVREAIDQLPHGQRAVIQLRDVEGCSAEEVCEALGLSEVNQRVLLHRARTRVRREIARYLKGRTP